MTLEAEVVVAVRAVVLVVAVAKVVVAARAAAVAKVDVAVKAVAEDAAVGAVDVDAIKTTTSHASKRESSRSIGSPPP